MKNQTIVILTGVTDDQYRSNRNDNPAICTSAGKRILLYRAIATATGKPLLLLSPHPRGHGNPSSLPEMESRFDRFAQRFSRASGIRKVRFFLNMLHYAVHVYRNTKSGDVLIIDNYELIYVLALYYCRLRGRRNPIILEYEDGKHVIDRGYPRIISGLAEKIGRRLVQGAILATPSLGDRLPQHLPKVVIPGILRPDIVFNQPPSNDEPVHFIYSGSLDVERGIPLLLDYLESPLLVENTVYHITGQGNYQERFLKLMKLHPSRIHFYGIISEQELARIRRLCHFGLNLQSSANPISSVTFPSKVFDYMNAGIRVISTKAAGVEQILGVDAFYLEHDSVYSLSNAISSITKSKNTIFFRCSSNIFKDFNDIGTVARIRNFFQRMSIS